MSSGCSGNVLSKTSGASKTRLESNLNPNNSRFRATLYNHKTGNTIMGKVQKPADSSTRTRFLAVFGGFVVKPGEKPNSSGDRD